MIDVETQLLSTATATVTHHQLVKFIQVIQVLSLPRFLQFLSS